MSNSEKLSVNKIKRLLTLFKFIASQKSGNKSTVLTLLNEKSINEISESIYNLLYNKNLNLNLSKSQKAKLRKIIKPNARSFEDISKKSFSFICLQSFVHSVLLFSSTLFFVTLKD